jgi:hypothetical protein
MPPAARPVDATGVAIGLRTAGLAAPPSSGPVYGTALAMAMQWGREVTPNEVPHQHTAAPPQLNTKCSLRDS